VINTLKKHHRQIALRWRTLSAISCGTGAAHGADHRLPLVLPKRNVGFASDGAP
jgi:hypothetical protein